MTVASESCPAPSEGEPPSAVELSSQRPSPSWQTFLGWQMLLYYLAVEGGGLWHLPFHTASTVSIASWAEAYRGYMASQGRHVIPS